MADAIADALESGQHLLVQAGTGTGKSLGYLAPALIRLARHPDERIVVATATLALQSQLANNDIPAALDAVEAVVGKRPRARDPEGPDELRLPAQGARQHRPGPTGADLGRRPGRDDQVRAAGARRSRCWAPRCWRCASGPKARPRPAVWPTATTPPRTPTGPGSRCRSRSGSASSPQRCPYGDACFVEQSRDEARAADLVVTNHALLAINAMHGGTALPEHDAVIIDEAHELVSRVTGAASAELTPAQIERVARRAMTYLEDEEALALLESADTLRRALDAAPLERVEDPDSAFVQACATVRNAARSAVSAMASNDEKPDTGEAPGRAAVKEVFDVAERMAALSSHDVVWVADRERLGREARVAPALGRRADAGQRLRRTHRGAHLGDAEAGRRVHRDRQQRGLAGRRAGRRRAGDRCRTRRSGDAGAEQRDDDRGAVARARCRVALRLPPAGHPLRRPPPAAARSRRTVGGVAGRDGRAALGLRWSDARPVLLAPRRGDGRGAHAQAAAEDDHPLPGRRPAAGADPAVRRRASRPACSARCRCGRGSTCPAPPVSW